MSTHNTLAVTQAHSPKKVNMHIANRPIQCHIHTITTQKSAKIAGAEFF